MDSDKEAFLLYMQVVTEEVWKEAVHAAAAIPDMVALLALGSGWRHINMTGVLPMGQLKSCLHISWQPPTPSKVETIATL